MLITFSGLDGAGKSTLIERLRAKLEGRDKRVAVFHMYYDVGLFACLRHVRDKLSGRASGRGAAARAKGTHAPRDPAKGNGFKASAARVGRAVVWNKTLRLCLYPVDLLFFFCCRLYVEKLKRQVLIMDRYFYDTLVDVSGGRAEPRSLRRVLALLTPTPSVPVYLDVSPERAHARKGEYSIDYLSRRRVSYEQLFPEVENRVVLSGDDDIETNLRSLEKVVFERMNAG